MGEGNGLTGGDAVFSPTRADNRTGSFRTS